MPVSLSTLVQLLRDLHEELRTCIDRENPPSIKEPILLGDFIVEAYNNYLAQAKGLCDDPIVQSLPEMVPSGAAGMEEESKKERHSRRLQKMGEVSLATRSLLTALQGATKHSKPSEPNEVPAAMALLQSLEVALGYGTQTRESCNALVDQYNRCLALLQGVLQDPVLESVFPRLEQVTADVTELQGRFSELRMAQHALFSYIAKLRASGRLAVPDHEGDSMADAETGGS